MALCSKPAAGSSQGGRLQSLSRPLLAQQKRRLPHLSFATVHVAVALLALSSLLLFPPSATGDAHGTAFVVASEQVKQVVAPVGALALGLVFHQIEQLRVTGKLLIYFGAQTGMNLYMKAVLSKAVVSEELGLVGIPAAFLVTGIQQLTAFMLFAVMVPLSWMTPHSYTPKSLTTKRDLISVCCFAFTFAFNIGLNNFSLSLLPISLNLIIRSCLPLSTAISQNVLGLVGLAKGSSIKPKEFAVMFAGVVCAGIATVAKAKGSDGQGKDSENLLLGVLVGTLSIFSGAMNFVLAGFLGTSMKLNPLDTTCYMALPATMFLLVPILFMPHPVWPSFGMMTDWQVFLKILELSPQTILLLILSGVFAFSYNVLQYALVQSLSPAYTAFAGNMNKAATVALSLVLGLEHLPDGVWGLLMFAAIAGNIGSFTYYSSMPKEGKQTGH